MPRGALDYKFPAWFQHEQRPHFPDHSTYMGRDVYIHVYIYMGRDALQLLGKKKIWEKKI